MGLPKLFGTCDNSTRLIGLAGLWLCTEFVRTDIRQHTTSKTSSNQKSNFSPFTHVLGVAWVGAKIMIFVPNATKQHLFRPQC